MKIDLDSITTEKLDDLGKFLDRNPEELVTEAVQNLLSNAYTVTFRLNLSEYNQISSKARNRIIDEVAKEILLSWGHR